ncbi:imm11 family protein [Lysinibacillus telephonicus]|nr:DUF1629 domain-containing protein [Lysinibacillus telephonicus]
MKDEYKMSYFRLLASYKRDVYFFYSDENKYNRFDLEKGIPYSQSEKLLYVVDRFDPYLEQYDILPTVGGKLVSLKLKRLIERLGSDCEFIPAIIKSTETGEINDSYFVMNVLNLIPCLDHSRSDYEPLVKSIPDGPISLNFIALIPGSLNGYHIVRMKESKEEIVVDEVFVDACRKEKIKGVLLVKEGNVRSPEFVDL